MTSILPGSFVMWTSPTFYGTHAPGEPYVLQTMTRAIDHTNHVYSCLLMTRLDAPNSKITLPYYLSEDSCVL